MRLPPTARPPAARARLPATRPPPQVFECGAGEMMGNKLFQGFDEAIRGLGIGQTTVLDALGGEWNRELMFEARCAGILGEPARAGVRGDAAVQVAATGERRGVVTH